jgi:site-specific DNA-cytosine methylase
VNKLNIFDEKKPKVMVHRGVLRKGKFGNGLKKEMSFTLDQTCGRDLTIKEGVRIRRLTPIECERLQGFPDNWTDGVSDTQRYKMMGNAVTVNVIKAITEKLFNIR